MSEQTPSQAEGERDDVTAAYDPPRTTPSQAEGERDDVEEVTQAPPGEGTHRRESFARARDDEEPGAHSGFESQARERVVPGTASAAEGYGPSGGTASGDPLTGVEGLADEQSH